MKRMKRMKKFVSLLLTAIMVFAMAAPVFADPDTDQPPTTTTGSTVTRELKLENPISGHTYTAYQIFSGDISGDQGQVTNDSHQSGFTLSTVDWGNGIVKETLLSNLGLDSGTTPRALAEKIVSDFTADAASIDAFTKKVAISLSNKGKPLTKEGENNYVSANVAPGYYIIIDTVDGTSPTVESVSRYMVEVVGPSTIVKPKSGNTDVDKVVEGEKEITAAIGEPRTFQLIATLPENYADYDEFYLKFNDTMKHLEFIASGEGIYDADQGSNADGIKIEVGKPLYTTTTGEKKFTFNNKLLVYEEEPVELTNYNAPEWDADRKTLTVEIPNVGILGGAGKVVVVTYNARLTEDAVVISGTDDSNINTVNLDFSNNPNWRPNTHPNDQPNRPTGTTPDKQVEVLTPQLVINKVDGDNKMLSGAEFKLTPTGQTPMYEVMVETTKEFVEDANGTYWKLKDGTYTTDNPNDPEGNFDEELYESTTTKYRRDLTARVNKVVTDTSGKSVTAEVSEVDGKVMFTGLAVGTYKLEETKAPEGYNKVIGEMTVNVSYNNGAFTVLATPATTDVDNNNNITVSSAGNNHELSINFINNKGAQLPETGGIGTTIFYVLGSILALGAGIVLITRRRMNAEQ